LRLIGACVELYCIFGTAEAVPFPSVPPAYIQEAHPNVAKALH